MRDAALVETFGVDNGPGMQRSPSFGASPAASTAMIRGQQDAVATGGSVSRAESGGPRFVRYFGPLIDVLKELGGSGSPEEVRSMVASRLATSDEEHSEQPSSGTSRQLGALLPRARWAT